MEQADSGMQGEKLNKDSASQPITMKAHIEKSKMNYLKDLMTRTKGDITAACRLSELSRAHLYQLIKKYNINPHLNGERRKS